MTLQLRATRIHDAPLIIPNMDRRMGENICNPAVIRVPEWVSNPLGRYYLYFSDHKGTYIRMAFAEHVLGPWRMHEPGVLDISESRFPVVDPPEPPPEERPPWAQHMKGGYMYAHIASPDVHVDTDGRRILMYFHGLLPNGDQATRFAASSDGRRFEVMEPLLGPPYFRAFERGCYIFTIAWGGAMWRSPSWDKPFSQGPQIVHYDALGGRGEGFRHGETFVVGDTLFVLFTWMGDAPERLRYCTVDLRDEWPNWHASEIRELLAPELPWEGTDLPITTSTMGAERHRVRELRDACVFVDNDMTYLFYCGAGESAIGVSRLDVVGV